MFQPSTTSISTGVFNLNGLEFIHDDIIDGDDPDYEDFLAQESARCLAEGISFNEDSLDSCDYEQGTAYIGMIKNADGKWEPDPEAEYSAIARMDGNVLQVVRSKWAVSGAGCSPCYPYQVDGDTPGQFWGYAPPPDVVGDCGDDLKPRIVPASEALGALAALKGGA